MSRTFPDQIRRLAEMTPMLALSDGQIANMEAGRKFAAEFVEAVKADELPPDGLMFAIRLLGNTGKGRDQIMRGFLQGMQRALAEVC